MFCTRRLSVHITLDAATTYNVDSRRTAARRAVHDQVEGRFWPDADGFVVCASEVDVQDADAIVVSTPSSDEVVAHMNVYVTALVFNTLGSGGSVADGCVTRVIPEPSPRFALDNEDDAAWTQEEDSSLVRSVACCFFRSVHPQFGKHQRIHAGS